MAQWLAEVCQADWSLSDSRVPAVRPDAAGRRQISETKRLDDVLDRLNTAIKVYLTSIIPDALSNADHHQVREGAGLRSEYGAGWRYH